MKTLPEIRQYLSNYFFPTKDIESNKKKIINLLFYSPDFQRLSTSETINLFTDVEIEMAELLKKEYNQKTKDNLETENLFKKRNLVLIDDVKRLTNFDLDFKDYLQEVDFIKKVMP